MRMASLTLHSNMFLLIRIQEDKTNVDRTFLHSNMFLLILVFLALNNLAVSFTFQYVSINTFVKLKRPSLLGPLHSNMFLLIQIYITKTSNC